MGGWIPSPFKLRKLANIFRESKPLAHRQYTYLHFYLQRPDVILHIIPIIHILQQTKALTNKHF